MKVSTLLFSTLLLVLFACAKEEEENNSTDQSLSSGEWYYESTDGVEGDACKKQTSIEFTNDGTYLLHAFAIVSGSCTNNMLSGTYTADETNITVTLFGIEAPSTFTISDGILTITGVNPVSGLTQSSSYDKISG